MQYEISWCQRIEASCLADALKEARKRAFERNARFTINGNPVVLNSDVSTISFTEREKAVMQYLAQGCSNQEIAKELGLEIRSVKAYMNRLFAKTDSRNRVELVVKLVTHAFKEDANEFNVVRQAN